jgi:uncharacterized coiled-coil protein SlyX
MSKTDFIVGTPLTYRWFDAMQHIQFDGLDEDGHYKPITADDIDLTNNPLLNSVSSIQANHDNAEAKQLAISPIVSNISAQNTSYSSRITVLENSNTTQNTTLTSLNNTYNSLNTTNNGHVTSIASLDSRVTYLENNSPDYTSLSNRLTTIEGAITSLNSNVTTINNVNTTQTNNINSLDSRIDALEIATSDYTESEWFNDKASLVGVAGSFDGVPYNASNPELSYPNSAIAPLSGLAAQNGQFYQVVRTTIIKKGTEETVKVLTTGGKFVNKNGRYKTVSYNTTFQVRELLSRCVGDRVSHMCLDKLNLIFSRDVWTFYWGSARDFASFILFAGTNRSDRGSYHDGNGTVNYLSPATIREDVNRHKTFDFDLGVSVQCLTNLFSLMDTQLGQVGSYLDWTFNYPISVTQEDLFGARVWKLKASGDGSASGTNLWQLDSLLDTLAITEADTYSGDRTDIHSGLKHGNWFDAKLYYTQPNYTAV